MKLWFILFFAAAGLLSGGCCRCHGEDVSAIRMNFLPGSRVEMRLHGKTAGFTFWLQKQMATRKVGAADVLKLCYQAAYGPEHLLRDSSAAERYFYREFNAAQGGADEVLIEIISPDICRVNLRPWKAAGLPAEWLWRLFAASAGIFTDGDKVFAAHLAAAEKLIATGRYPVTLEQWHRVLRQAKPGMIHHSKAYHAAEKPSYRIISTRFLVLMPLLSKLKSLPAGANGIRVIAIDGRAASGKSTLAKYLGVMLDCDVIHMDDFFLPENLRTSRRLSEAGGNVHYERFIAEVLPKLRKDAGFSYGKFDCSIKKINGSIKIRKSPWRIVEGAYSHSPKLGKYADLKIFYHIDPAEQKSRIFKRNGAKALEIFLSRWIPMEEKYISTFNIRGNADIVLE